MKIEFVNHASTIFSYGDINLITDPWIEGEVFHDGWSLLSETKFKFSEFDRITHIWFSHEHPDHFFPPNVKAIPLENRKNIIVLFQKTNDKKVIEFCKKLNFKEIIELTPNKEYQLTDKFKIINAPFGHDSWLYIKTDQYTFLNTNDCVINTPEKANSIKKVIDKVDVLLTQFSYASKHGNENQPEMREKAVEDKKNQMRLQFDVFKPKIFIPIASYIWFSHEENFYMNDKVLNIEKVHSFSINNNVEPIVLYPSDIYEVGESHNNQESIDKYLNDLNKVSKENTKKTIPVPFDQIQKSGQKLIKQIRKEDFISFVLISFFPIKFYLTDLGKAVKFSTIFGLKKIQVKKEKTNIYLSSEVLEYCLKFNWGFGTTNVNGRYQTNEDKDSILFNYYVSVTDSLNHSDSTLKRVLNKIKRKIKTVYNKK